MAKRTSQAAPPDGRPSPLDEVIRRADIAGTGKVPKKAADLARNYLYLQSKGTKAKLPPNTLRRSEVAGFVLAEAMYPSGLKQPEHSHDLATLAVVLSTQGDTGWNQGLSYM